MPSTEKAHIFECIGSSTVCWSSTVCGLVGGSALLEVSKVQARTSGSIFFPLPVDLEIELQRHHHADVMKMN